MDWVNEIGSHLSHFVDKLWSPYFYFLVLWRKLSFARCFCCLPFFLCKVFRFSLFGDYSFCIIRKIWPFSSFFFSSKVKTIMWKKIITSLNFFSGFLFATAKFASITAMIFFHLILHPAVLIYFFHIFII